MDLEKYGLAGNIQELLSIKDDVEALSRRHGAADGSMPKIDLFDMGDSYRLLVEVPGVTQENLEVAIQGQTLIVAGIREPVEKDAKIITSERYRGHFQREISLPSVVERDIGQAHLQDGLLILTLPKAD